jgi:hypothetical protein
MTSTSWHQIPVLSGRDRHSTRRFAQGTCNTISGDAGAALREMRTPAESRREVNDT